MLIIFHTALKYFYYSYTVLVVYFSCFVNMAVADVGDFSLSDIAVGEVDFKSDSESPLSSPMLWFQTEPKAFAVWAPFGLKFEKSLSFRDWVMTARPGEKIPNFDNKLSLNCWEFIIYSSLRIGNLSLNDAKLVFQNKARGKNLYEIMGTLKGQGTYSITNSKVKLVWPPDIHSGDIVFMDNTGHVVQLLGMKNANRQELVVSFSPRPIWGEASQEFPAPDTYPEITTVESLIEQMIDLYPDVPSDWNKIQLRVNKLKPL